MTAPDRKEPRLERPDWDTAVWDSSPALRRIKDASDYYRASPWSVLGYCLAYLGASDSWRHLLGGTTGGRAGASPGSLYVVSVAPSGVGKSAAMSVGEYLLRIRGGHLSPRCADRYLKTPEGAYGIYQSLVEEETGGTLKNGKPETKRVVRQTEWQALSHVDEFGGMMKIGKNGNWIMEGMSQWFTGRFPPNDSLTTYRPALARNTHLSMFGGGQDYLMAGFLAGEGRMQGFASRLLLVDGAYKQLPPPPGTDVPEPLPIEVEIPRCSECFPCRKGEGWKEEMLRNKDPEEINDDFYLWPEHSRIIREIIWYRDQTLRLEVNLGHDKLVQRRAAKHLAVLSGRGETTLDDWDAAGELVAHSNALRAAAHEQLPEFIAAADEAESIRMTLRKVRIDEQKDQAEIVAAKALRRLWSSHPRGFMKSDVTRAVNSSEKRILAINGPDAGSAAEQVLEVLLRTDCVTYDGAVPGVFPPKGTRFRYVPADPLPEPD